jgi:hypothetical protein
VVELVDVEILVLDQVVGELLVRLLFRNNLVIPVLSRQRVDEAEPALALEHTRAVILPRIDDYATRMR